MIFERYIDSHKIILESTSFTDEHDIDVTNPCYRLGFAHQLMNLAGYDPMSLSAVFAATERISNAIAVLPWEVKSFTDDPIPSDNYLKHIFDKTIQTRYIFVKNLIKDVILHGNGYALIERDQTGKPTRLVYLKPGMCTVETDSTNTHVYYRIPMLREGLVEPIDVLHYYMYSPDGIIGLPLLDFANKSIRLAGYTEKASMAYFATGMRASGILTTNSPRLTDEQRKKIRESYLAGTSAEGGICVLEAGMQFSQMTNNARDGQLLDARQFNVQEIARYFNISPVQLGDLSHSQYNSIEQSQIDLLTNTLTSWLTMVETENNRKLVLPRDTDKFYIDLDTNCLLKTDRQSFASYITTLTSNSIITINEGRALLGMSPIDGGDVRNLHYAGTTGPDSNINNQDLNKSKDINKEV